MTRIYRLPLIVPSKETIEDATKFLINEMRTKDWSYNNSNTKESKEQAFERRVKALSYERAAGESFGIIYASTSIWTDCERFPDYFIGRVSFECKVGKYFESEKILSATITDSQMAKIKRYKSNVLFVDIRDSYVYIVQYPSLTTITESPKDKSSSSAKYRIALDTTIQYPDWPHGSLQVYQDKCRVGNYTNGYDYLKKENIVI